MTTAATTAGTYDVVTAVWGTEFIDLFLDFCIPNQLSPANLPVLPAGSRYRIFTSHEDAGRLLEDRRLESLRRLMPVDVVPVDMTEADRHAAAGQRWNTHKRMIACHRQSVAEAAAGQRAMIFLTPDIVLAEGTIAALLRMHASGARAVMTTGLRLSRDSFLNALTERNAARALAPRELVGLAMQHLHSWTGWLMADGTTTSDNPTAVYWPVRSGTTLEGILVRSFFLHPILVDPVHRTRLPGGPIDSHYIRDCCPDLSTVKVVEDSDTLAVFELSPEMRLIGNRIHRKGVSVLRLATVAARCNRYHLSYWTHAIRLHGGEFSVPWADAERQSAALAAAVERYRPAGALLHIGFQALRTLRRRREAYSATLHKTRRRVGRARYEIRERSAYAARRIRKAMRPPVTAKQLARPVRLWYGRAAKLWSRGVKRILRRAPLFGR